MGRTLTIDGVDFTSKWRPYESSWTSRAYIGESFQGQFIIDDDGTIDHAKLASRKVVEVWEDASGTNRCLYRGRVANKTLGRVRSDTGERMQWKVNTEDYNIDLRGIRIPYWARDSENDYTRVDALLSAYLTGTGSTASQARASTDLSSAIVASNGVTLPDANGGDGYYDTYPFDVLQGIIDLSGKTFFVYVADDGTGYLYYGDHTDTSYASDISISDTTAADGVDVYAPDRSGDAGEHDGQEVVTGGGVRYGEEYFEASDLASGETYHDKWEEHLRDEYVHNDVEAEALLNKYVGAKVNEQFRYTATWRMSAANVHRLKAGMQTSVQMNAADVHDATTLRAVQVTVTPLVPDENGDPLYEVTAEFGRPRGTPFRRHLRPKRYVAPRQPTADTNVAVRMYPSVHQAGGSETAEAFASPNLGVSDISSAWEGNASFEFYQLYSTPGNTATNLGPSWAATDAPAGQYALRGFIKRLSGNLLEIVQNGGTAVAQILANSRYGTGISEASQDNTTEWIARVYRPSSSSFVATLWTVGSPGSTKFDASATYENRTWTAAVSAYASAVEGDYLVIEVGTQHNGPITGGTGAGLRITDSGGTDLPENETAVDTSQNSWIELRRTIAGSTGSAPQPVTSTGNATVGDSGVFADADHEHEHGLLSTSGTHYHSSDQIEGGAGGAPTNVNYLVGTANGTLTNEIVVGTTPGGELGGTWASPTVDSTHSGSAHTDFIAKATVDAKGDILAATADNTVARVAVGTNGKVLTADSTAAAGVSWQTPSGGITECSPLTNGDVGSPELIFANGDTISVCV